SLSLHDALPICQFLESGPGAVDARTEFPAAQLDDLTHMPPSSPFSQFLEFGTLPNRAIITHTHTCRIHGEGAVSGSAEQTVQGDEYTRTQSDQSRGEHEHEHQHGTDHRHPV